MPDWKTVGATGHYWREILVRAFWDSLLFFFETRAGIWKAVVVFLLGAAVTTLIVWIVRDREALTEHLKANVGIAIAGGLFTWIFVFIAYAIAEPFMQQREVVGLLSLSSEGGRAAVLGRETAELQRNELEKQLPRNTVQGQACSGTRTLDSQPCTIVNQGSGPSLEPSWTKASSGQGGPLGPILAAELVQTFKTIPAPCMVKVTVSTDKPSLRDTIRWLLTEPQTSGGAGCRLWENTSPPNIDDSPSPKQTSDNGVVIHWNLALKDGERIAHFLDASGLKLSISHQMPPHSEPNLIWIDIGPGSPWKTP